MSVEAGIGQKPKRFSALVEARRRQIIDATIRSIAEHGLNSTTLATVAEAAGLSQGILIFHFKTKNRLLEETLRFSSWEYTKNWQAAAADAAPDRLAMLVALVVTDFLPAVCNTKTLALWHAFLGEADARPMYRTICEADDAERIKAMLEFCGELLAQNPNPQWTPELAALSIDSLSDGLWQNFHMSGGAMDQGKCLEVVLHFLGVIFPDLSKQIIRQAEKILGNAV